jgi:hypothetical protein
MPTYSQGNASHWLPSGINPPCTCPGHAHQADEDGQCDVPNDNNPSSFGFCPCQHNANQPVTTEKYEAWQQDIRDGKIGPDDRPDELGLTY